MGQNEIKNPRAMFLTHFCIGRVCVCVWGGGGMENK